MPEAADIEQTITAYIHGEILGNNQTVLDPDENIFTAGHVDSVGIMRLIGHLESALGIKIPPADLIPQNFRTIRVMAAYLASRSGSVASAAPGAPPL